MNAITGHQHKAVACIITFRQGIDRARSDNLFTVLRWLANWPEMSVVLVEQDLQAHLTAADLPHPNIDYRFVYNPGPFNKSWGLNAGVRACRAEWLLFHDGDIILGHALTDTLAAIGSGHHVISPFSQMIDLDPDESAHVRSGHFDWLPERPDPGVSDRRAMGEFMPLAGASVLISRSAFLTVGGWDERFEGWGGEDDAMSYLLRRAQVPATELDVRPALHLHHHRKPETTSNQPNYQTNLRILKSHQQLSDAELARCAEVRRSLMGYPEKYRRHA